MKFFLILTILCSFFFKAQVTPPAKYKLDNSKNEIIIGFLKNSNYKKNLAKFCRNFTSKYSSQNKRLYDHYKEINGKCTDIIENKEMTNAILFQSLSTISKENIVKLSELYKVSNGTIDQYNEFIFIDENIQNYIENSILEEINKIIAQKK
ncbi:hypothetical protein [Chryseobacterium aquaticum]|uniref:hypothetical protein n=1 Tax=Chryseobacterium aquaticum TaxID=452084 RepID=UPI003F70119F